MSHVTRAAAETRADLRKLAEGFAVQDPDLDDWANFGIAVLQRYESFFEPIGSMKQQLHMARSIAHVLAQSWIHDARPPQRQVDEALTWTLEYLRNVK